VRLHTRLVSRGGAERELGGALGLMPDAGPAFGSAVGTTHTDVLYGAVGPRMQAGGNGAVGVVVVVSTAAGRRWMVARPGRARRGVGPAGDQFGRGSRASGLPGGGGGPVRGGGHLGGPRGVIRGVARGLVLSSSTGLRCFAGE